MNATTTMAITPDKDIVILLGGKPFTIPITHLTLETAIINAMSEEDDLPAAHFAGPSRLGLYNGEKLVASTEHYDLSPDSRVVQLSEAHTRIY